MPKVLKTSIAQTMGNLALADYNDIFGNDTVQADGECIVELPLTDLFPPDFHPFNVIDDEAMTRLAGSVKRYGVREPGLVRPREDGAGNLCGGYELLCGNRRKRACELAGLQKLPVIIREMDDDTAAIVMVDSNLEQREKLLFSEKAWAYRVKLEALNHRGLKSDVPGQLSVDILCEQTGESKNQIFRLVRLTELVPDLIDKVDTKKLAFNPAVELSYLSRKEQSFVVEAMAKYEVKPSLSQAVRLKKQAGELTEEAVDEILSEDKKAPKPDKEVSKYSNFFPENYTSDQMDKVITGLLRVWKNKLVR